MGVKLGNNDELGMERGGYLASAFEVGLEGFSIDRFFFREKKTEMSTKSPIFECLLFRIFFRSVFFSR